MYETYDCFEQNIKLQLSPFLIVKYKDPLDRSRCICTLTITYSPIFTFYYATQYHSPFCNMVVYHSRVVSHILPSVFYTSGPGCKWASNP